MGAQNMICTLYITGLLPHSCTKQVSWLPHGCRKDLYIWQLQVAIRVQKTRPAFHQLVATQVQKTRLVISCIIDSNITSWLPNGCRKWDFYIASWLPHGCTKQDFDLYRQLIDTWVHKTRLWSISPADCHMGAQNKTLIASWLPNLICNIASWSIVTQLFHIQHSLTK